MNKRGIALIFSYLVIVVLSILGAAFLARSVSEDTITRRYEDSARAFWIAEAGLSQAYFNWKNNIAQPAGAVAFSGGTYSLDTTQLPQVSVTGAFGSSQRTLQAFFIGIPRPFNNMFSTGGNLRLNYSGFLGGAIVNVNGNTVYSGTYSKDSRVTANFNPAPVNSGTANTTIPIADFDQNGTPNEFTDFLTFGQSVIADYPADEVVHIQTTGTVTVFPNQQLRGTKVIFVEGQAAGQGNVNIIFDATWHSDEDMTIISTGTINYLEPLNFPDSRLSTISWLDYNEGSVLLSNRVGVVYAHNNANFTDRFEIGFTAGNIIANGNLTLDERWSAETFNYSSRAADGDLPPGFQWLSATNGNLQLLDWEE